MSFILLIGVACASGNCRVNQETEKRKKMESVQSPDMTPKDPGGGMPDRPIDRVMVYKADGSLQCGQGKGLSPEEMQKELEGVKVYSAINRHDGDMHPMACGLATGQVNVYEIARRDLDLAKRRGFKLWLKD